MGCSTGSIQLLRGSHSDFEQTNPIVDLGEFVYTYDPVTFKIGDGVTPWSGLPVATREICEEPCVKTFRLYSKINYQYSSDVSNLPATSGMPMFDTQIDILPDEHFKITFENTISSAGVDVSPDDIQINGQKTTIAMVNNTVFGSGSIFEGSVEEGGRLVVGVNDDNYEDNQGYFLVKYDDCDCATNTCNTTAAPTTTTTTTTSTTTSTTTTTTTQPSTTPAPQWLTGFEGTDMYEEFGRCVAVSKNGAYLVVGLDGAGGKLKDHCDELNIYKLVNGEYIFDAAIAGMDVTGGSSYYNHQAVAISDNGILAVCSARTFIVDPGSPNMRYVNIEPEIQIFNKNNSAGGGWTSWQTSTSSSRPALAELNLPRFPSLHYAFPYDIQLVISSDGKKLLALQRGLQDNDNDQGLFGFSLDLAADRPDDDPCITGSFKLNRGDLQGQTNLRNASIAIDKDGSHIIVSNPDGNTNLYDWQTTALTVDQTQNNILTWNQEFYNGTEGSRRGFGASTALSADISEDGNYVAMCRKYINVSLNNREERYIYWYRKTVANNVTTWNEIYKEITLNTDQAAPCTDGDYDIGVKLTDNGRSLHIIGVETGNTACGGVPQGAYYVNQTMFYDDTSGVITPNVTIHPDGDQLMITGPVVDNTSIRRRTRTVITIGNNNPSLVYAPTVCTTEAGAIIFGNPYDSTMGQPINSPLINNDRKGSVRIVKLNTTKP